MASCTVLQTITVSINLLLLLKALLKLTLKSQDENSTFSYIKYMEIHKNSWIKSMSIKTYINYKLFNKIYHECYKIVIIQINIKNIKYTLVQNHDFFRILLEGFRFMSFIFFLNSKIVFLYLNH